MSLCVAEFTIVVFAYLTCELMSHDCVLPKLDTIVDIVYMVQFMLCIVRFFFYNIQGAGYCVYGAFLDVVGCTWCFFNVVGCTWCCLCCTLWTVLFMLYSVHCLIYIV